MEKGTTPKEMQLLEEGYPDRRVTNPCSSSAIGCSSGPPQGRASPALWLAMGSGMIKQSTHFPAAQLLGQHPPTPGLGALC